MYELPLHYKKHLCASLSLLSLGVKKNAIIFAPSTHCIANG